MVWVKVFEENLHSARCEGAKPPYFGKLRRLAGTYCHGVRPLRVIFAHTKRFARNVQYHCAI